MGRTCREELASGGTLIISENDFRIEYFFPGPDGRYGGVRSIFREGKLRPI